MIAQTAIQPDNREFPAVDLVDGLEGVPKPVLRTVFGKQLGRRIWERTRRPRTAHTRTLHSGPVEPSTTRSASGGSHANHVGEHKKMATELVNSESLVGMLEYLSRRASETLRENHRLAQSVTVTLCFDDSTRQVASDRLARPTTDPSELCEAVTQLFRSLPAAGGALASINLSTKSVEASPEVEIAPDFDCALAGVSP